MESKSSSEPDDWQEKVFQHKRIHSAAYSPSTRTLKIRFGNEQKEYLYHAPPELWAEFKDNLHPHSFIRTTIQPFFKEKKK